MKKTVFIILMFFLMLGQVSCGRREASPSSAGDLTEQDSRVRRRLFDRKRDEYVHLYETPSVSKASIYNTLENNLFVEKYEIDLTMATASIMDSDHWVDYYLDSEQIDDLCRLLSQYTITVYDDQPYWPTGNYCTMIQLFDYDVTYEDGYYREYGATHYPEGWEDFIQDLKELITSGEAATES